MTTDTAALAANDDTQDKTLGEHFEEAQAAAPPPADAQPADAEPPPIPSQREADLIRRLAAAEDRLAAFEARREKEQQLLAERDSNLASIESAKNQVAAYKKSLAETEAQIAALLKQPLPAPFSETPIGRAIADAEQASEPAPLAWERLLPPVPAESVRMLVGIGDELPTVEAVLHAEIAPQLMEGEKRVLKANQTVECYGSPWLVSRVYQEEEVGVMRANVLPLLTKDEWQQLHEEKYGRAVQDFDQNDESKEQRQRGGPWCGLVVKVGRKVYVVGPQERAMHLAYDPPEEATPADDGWDQVAARAKAVIEASGMSCALYCREYGLPYLAVSQLLATGEGPTDQALADAIAKGFPPFEDGPGDDDDGEAD